MGTIVICRGKLHSSLIFPVELSVSHGLISVVNEEFRVLNERLAALKFDGIVPMFSIPDMDDNFNFNKENLGFFGVGCGILSSLTEFISYIAHIEISRVTVQYVCAESRLKLHLEGKPQMVRRVINGNRVRVAYSEAELVAAVSKAQFDRDDMLRNYADILKTFKQARAHINFGEFDDDVSKILARAVERRERELARPISGGVRIRRK